jgi:hypothetical protein
LKSSGIDSDWFARIGTAGWPFTMKREPSLTVYVIPQIVPAAL